MDPNEQINRHARPLRGRDGAKSRKIPRRRLCREKVRAIEIPNLRARSGNSNGHGPNFRRHVSEGRCREGYAQRESRPDPCAHEDDEGIARGVGVDVGKEGNGYDHGVADGEGEQ